VSGAEALPAIGVPVVKGPRVQSFGPPKNEVLMTAGAMELLRKGWASLVAWATAMDYSAFDYTNDRIRRLEHEVKELKDEIGRTRISAGTADRGFEQRVPSG
jgi:hypothetical protein